MRASAAFLAVIVLAMSLQAQVPANYTNWFSDDFTAASLHENWNPLKGTWTPGNGVSCSGGGEHLLLIGKNFIPRQHDWAMEASTKSVGAGVVFNMEDPLVLRNAHFVMVKKNLVVMGYFDYLGTMVETRTADYPNQGGDVKITVLLAPGDRLYRVVVNGRDLANEELRYVSGYAGLYAAKSGVSFSSVRFAGSGRLSSPSFFLKSNKTQIDNLSYMTLLDNALLIGNPVVGMVQRISGVGTYINEIPIAGANSQICGIAVDENRFMYVADKGDNSVRIFNPSLTAEKPISSDLQQPVGVAVTKDRILVLDREGIKVFDKSGTFIGAKAKGMFKDAKNLWVEENTIYVADYGNGQVKLLDADSYALRTSISQDLVSPWDVFVDMKDSLIYVADPGAFSVMKY